MKKKLSQYYLICIFLNISLIVNAQFSNLFFESRPVIEASIKKSDSYARLSNEITSSYYRVENNTLQFIFYKEYGGDNEPLTYYFIDEQRKIYIPPAVNVNKGINYISVNINNNTSYPASTYYILYTVDAKGGKKYLRFYKP